MLPQKPKKSAISTDITRLRNNCADNISMIFRFSLSAVIAVLAAFSLHSETLLVPDKADFSEYPEIRVTAGVSSLYPAHAVRSPESESRGTPVFYIEETFRGKSREAEIISVSKRDRSLTGLDLIIVADVTRSVSESDFRKFLKAAENLRSSLGPQDRIALFAFNGDLFLKKELTHASDESFTEIIRSLKREGSRTRIYDALYGGLSTAARIRSETAAASETVGKDKIIRKTAVIIFTDTKDEGSFISEGDLHSLIHSGSEWKIPVYSFLAGSGARSEPFKRLALKTGGRVFGLSSRDTEAFIGEAEKFRNGLYEIRFRSRISVMQLPLPGDTVNYRIRILDGTQTGAYTLVHEVPLASVYGGGNGTSSGPVNAFLWIFLLLLGAGFLVLIVLSMRKKAPVIPEPENKENETRSGWNVVDLLRPAPKPANLPPPVVDGNMHEYVQEQKIYDNLYSKGDFFDEEEITVGNFNPAFAFHSGESGRPAAAREESVVQAMQNPERYMQEYAYHLLQLAIRSGEKYSDGRLTLLKDGPREETKEYDLFLSSTVIGSGKWSHIRVHDISVSPVHAKIKRVDGRFIVYDLLSRTGVFLNGKKLLRPRALTDGDDLIIGKLHFVFSGFREDE